MAISEYLQRQAEACLRIARASFDLTTAERLRHMAAELSAKAAEFDGQKLQPHMMRSNGGHSRNGSSDAEHG